MQNAFPQVPAGTLSLRLSLTAVSCTISSGYAPSARGTYCQLGVRTSRSWVMLARFGVPAWRMIEASSRFRMSMTASTPG
jgi:hypothetical protein